MRRLCLIVGLSAMLALPVCAQQSQEGTRDGAKAATDNSAAGNAESTNAVPAASRSSFALPEAPRAMPFPGPSPAAASSDEGGPGRLTPKWELAGMYSYINFA